MITLVKDVLDTMRFELRRGVLAMAVMAAMREEHYGYSLRQVLLKLGLEIDEGTLYPLIRRLADKGLLISEWRVVSGRERRYYRLSPDGARVLEGLQFEWRKLNQALELQTRNADDPD